ncbi:MAG: hypothetical protein SZ59_C0006G0029 [candidate division TM6 bacterium GW2011_GWF2_28_16]|nr:MAG: hypothetical protein SZ59_C0006G0029 [candidate division TM6 bacterium GW2011_GWF2_28_16]
MKLLDFLDEIKNNENINFRTICFTGENYYILFLSRLLSFLQNQNKLPAQYRNLIIDSLEKREIQSNLAQTFLGQKYFYWLGDCMQAKLVQKEIDLLLNYTGPHFIAFYLDKEKSASIFKSSDKNNLNIIELSDNLDLDSIINILNFFEIKLTNKKIALIKQVFLNLDNNINLDQLSILVNYLDLIKAEPDINIINYLTLLIGKNSPSLNLLAKYFFEKNAKEFFNIWVQINKDYPDVFWLSFWSEKLYRAYFVVKYLNNNNFAKAKSVSFGLPYNFIKSDWKKNSINQLSSYHDFLYTNDYKIKTGSQFCFLDYFYLNYFIN